jgi:hypothetical protein
MSRIRKQRDSDREERLREAQAAQETAIERGEAVDRQLSLVGRLTEGWRRVHETNHLAQIFHDEGRL